MNSNSERKKAQNKPNTFYLLGPFHCDSSTQWARAFPPPLRALDPDPFLSCELFCAGALYRAQQGPINLPFVCAYYLFGRLTQNGAHAGQQPQAVEPVPQTWARFPEGWESAGRGILRWPGRKRAACWLCSCSSVLCLYTHTIVSTRTARARHEAGNDEKEEGDVHIPRPQTRSIKMMPTMTVTGMEICRFETYHACVRREACQRQCLRPRPCASKPVRAAEKDDDDRPGTPIDIPLPYRAGCLLHMFHSGNCPRILHTFIDQQRVKTRMREALTARRPVDEGRAQDDASVRRLRILARYRAGFIVLAGTRLRQAHGRPHLLTLLCPPMLA